eukprot:1392423-Amorphochlora_amoeboformis.AAC.1
MTNWFQRILHTYGLACSRDGHVKSCERDMAGCHVLLRYLEARYYRVFYPALSGNLRAIFGMSSNL